MQLAKGLFPKSAIKCVGVALLLSETLRVACFFEGIRLRSGTTRHKHRSTPNNASEKYILTENKKDTEQLKLFMGIINFEF